MLRVFEHSIAGLLSPIFWTGLKLTEMNQTSLSSTNFDSIAIERTWLVNGRLNVLSERAKVAEDSGDFLDAACWWRAIVYCTSGRKQVAAARAEMDRCLSKARRS